MQFLTCRITTLPEKNVEMMVFTLWSYYNASRHPDRNLVKRSQTQCQCQLVYTLDIHCSVHSEYTVLEPVLVYPVSSYTGATLGRLQCMHSVHCSVCPVYTLTDTGIGSGKTPLITPPSGVKALISSLFLTRTKHYPNESVGTSSSLAYCMTCEEACFSHSCLLQENTFTPKYSRPLTECLMHPSYIQGSSRIL